VGYPGSIKQMSDDSEAIQTLLEDWRNGRGSARDRLAELVYDDLRQLAHARMRHERHDHTLDATALVHEVYLRLFGGTAIDLKDRTHLLAVAARQLRRVLVNHARDLNAAKRGGDAVRVTLNDFHAFGQRPPELMELDMALTQLSEVDARAAQVVELRYFGGLSEPETAEALGISVSTVKRDWQFARVWLLRQLGA
jgi:RNA polymerase sigma factor (TIGR02999 family)